MGAHHELWVHNCIICWNKGHLHLMQGAITKRMTAIEEMAGMDVLCSDKTGTLTLNKLTVDKTMIEVIFLIQLQPYWMIDASCLEDAEFLFLSFCRFLPKVLTRIW